MVTRLRQDARDQSVDLSVQVLHARIRQHDGAVSEGAAARLASSSTLTLFTGANVSATRHAKMRREKLSMTAWRTIVGINGSVANGTSVIRPSPGGFAEVRSPTPGGFPGGTVVDGSPPRAERRPPAGPDDRHKRVGRQPNGRSESRMRALLAK
jgi:hypothetical protein